MRKIFTTYISTSSPSGSNNIAAGFSLGSEWRNTTTGDKFFHKTDGVWVALGGGGSQDLQSVLDLGNFADDGSGNTVTIEFTYFEIQDVNGSIGSLSGEEVTIGNIADEGSATLRLNPTRDLGYLEFGKSGFLTLITPIDVTGNTIFKLPAKGTTTQTFAMLSDLTGLGGITRTIINTSGSATMGATALTDYVYNVTGAHTMTLPTAVSNTNRYTVKNKHTSNITVNTTSSQTIDGTLTISLNSGASVDIISDNTNWNII